MPRKPEPEKSGAGRIGSGPSGRATMSWALMAVMAAGVTYYAVNSSHGKETVVSLVKAGRTSMPLGDAVAVRHQSDRDSQLEQLVATLGEELKLTAIANKDLERRIRTLEVGFMSDLASVGHDEAPTETAEIVVSDNKADRAIREIDIARVSGADEPIVIPVPLPANAPVGNEPVVAVPVPAANVSVTEFGLELAPTTSVSEGRAIWSSLLQQFPQHLAGLDPRIAIKDADNGGIELRLVAGPFRNAAAVSDLCVRLISDGQRCTTAVYDGQRITM